MYSTATPATRNFTAAHTYNIAFSDEIGHFEYCAKVAHRRDRHLRQAAGRRHQQPRQRRAGPAGDDEFCLPASASLLVKIGGCLDIDGDFDGVAYKFTWPGSISNPTADQLLNAAAGPVHQPDHARPEFHLDGLRIGHRRNESDDTAFGARRPVPAAHHQPGRPHPGVGCVNPPPDSDFYPFYSTTQIGGTLLVAARWPLHPGHHEQVRRQCARRVRPAARDLLPDAPVRHGHQAIQRLPQGPQHAALSRDLTRGSQTTTCKQDIGQYRTPG